MDHDGFRYDFTVREMAYFLFGSKKCPSCGGVLRRRKVSETVKGGVFNTRSAAPFRSDSDVRHYFYVYDCERCHASWRLSELANRGRR